MHNIPVPTPPNAHVARENQLIEGGLEDDGQTPQSALKGGKPSEKSKKVKFSGGGKIDEDHEGDWKDQEIKRLEQRYAE